MALVTVLMTTLNSARFVEEAINSILAQTYQDWELIIVDGGSSDDTVKILRNFTDSRIHIYECAGLRRSAQLNYALGKANGEYLAIMDSDDVALPERLKLQIQYLQTNASISLVGSWAEYIDENGNVLEINKRPLTHSKIIKNLFSFGHPSLSSIMMKRSIFSTCEYFNESLQGLEDVEWYLRISTVATFGSIPVVLMKFRQTRNSLSRNEDTPNRNIFIACVDSYFVKHCSSEKIRPPKVLWGIAHYYYGDYRKSRKILLECLLNEGCDIQTLRYLLPTVLFSGKQLHAFKKNYSFVVLANYYRKIRAYFL
jgi:glycosyltransferase involved in cell wall biosynthesis